MTVIDPTGLEPQEAPETMPLEEVRRLLTEAGYEVPGPIQENHPYLLLTRKLDGDKVTAGGIILAQEEIRMSSEVVMIGAGIPPEWISVGDEVFSFRLAIHEAHEVNRIIYKKSEVNHGAFYIIEAGTVAINGIVRKGKT